MIKITTDTQTGTTTDLPTQLKLHQWAALLIAFFAFVMSAFISGEVFERLPHLEDEMAYLYQARTYAGGQLVVESPELARAYWQPFVKDLDGLRFSKYSPGWPLLLATGVALGQTWVINAFFAALNVALVYRLGREIFNADVGVMAALLAAFSPMALLLNGTLMGHTSAFFGVLLFTYAYWRLLRSRRALLWGIAAGVALGAVATNRPLTALGIALPFIAWSGLRLLGAFSHESPLRQFWGTLKPLLALSGFALVVMTIIPVYNYAATGDPTQNLYELVWSYDRIGFGECCGHSAVRGEGGHNLERAVRHARFDLSLMAADLFGWVVDVRSGIAIAEITPAIEEHLLTRGVYYPYFGLSWLLLPLAVLVGLGWQRALLVIIWLALGLGWLVFPFEFGNGYLTRDATFSWFWVGIAAVWTFFPMLWFMRSNQRVRWTWLLITIAIAIIGVQMTYWIGSQRYSTRYYFETLGALSLLSALPLAWLARKTGLRIAVYAFLLAALVFGLGNHGLPRTAVLHGFNNIRAEVLEEVEQRRENDQPVLVIVTGDNVRWRAYGTLMAQTDPYLRNDIVAAWDWGGQRRNIIVSQPERYIIDMQAENNEAWFVEPE